ncbi:protein bangles and beads-like [Punica granatum]|uniref:Uncharacterized protein n=2 Tax=Punica granatum TaxID=22663 RepID=A0A218X4Y9_PUNGR|nr:protein bangles and beads-like [Punica granatum]OWM79766.1 hypothetical protein CDL15_Pgr023178 [Punica granatum]PKI64209.1 hypothetical protein CRG98_015396 [Punica granatum]
MAIVESQVETAKTDLPEDATEESTKVVADGNEVGLKAATPQAKEPKEEMAAANTKVETIDKTTATEETEKNDKEITPPPEDESPVEAAVQEIASESVPGETFLQAEPAEKQSVETKDQAKIEAAEVIVTSPEALVTVEAEVTAKADVEAKAVEVKEEERAVETTEKVTEAEVAVKVEAKAIGKADEEGLKEEEKLAETANEVLAIKTE